MLDHENSLLLGALALAHKVDSDLDSGRAGALAGATLRMIRFRLKIIKSDGPSQALSPKP